MSVTDVVFREVVPETPVFEVEEISKARLSETQPKELGFPFVIHAPVRVLTNFSEATLRDFGGKGTRVEKAQPIFLRTKVEYMRITFNLGDSASAVKMFNLLSAFTPGVYRNWK